MYSSGQQGWGEEESKFFGWGRWGGHFLIKNNISHETDNYIYRQYSPAVVIILMIINNSWEIFTMLDRNLVKLYRFLGQNESNIKNNLLYLIFSISFWMHSSWHDKYIVYLLTGSWKLCPFCCYYFFLLMCQRHLELRI